MQNKDSLSTKELLSYLAIGIIIGLAYTIWLVVIVDWMDQYEIKTDFVILPNAYAQILPFELQLEQIREPEECTRKVVQGRSAEIPFSMKVFYDTTGNTKLEFKQQGTSFPIIQKTNQVMTFYTNGTDQYQIYMEMNYNVQRERQVYIEFLTANAIVLSMQEKFNTNRFCMTIFVNTVLPPTVLTKEQIFGESLDYIAKIPAMVIAFNANSMTTNTSISFMWMLMLGIFVLSILTLISSQVGKGKFDSKIKDLDDSIEQANKMALSIDGLVTSVTDTLVNVKTDLKAILSIPEIKEKIPRQQKPSKIHKLLTFVHKKDEEKFEENKKDKAEQNKTPSEEVVKELETIEEQETVKEQKEKESGGFILPESEQKVSEPTKEENPMNYRPEIFLQVLKGIDYEKKVFKEGMFDKFTYDELNESYGWIVKYRTFMEDQGRKIPSEKYLKQRIIEKIIYEAIFRKIERHQVKTETKGEDDKND